MRTKKYNVQMMVLTALFVALTAVGAFLKIPTATVAITLQLLFTFLAGVLLGPGWGALSQLVYVLLGLVGVPIFTEGGGFAYVLKPSFGFLIGLIPCAAVVGALTRKREHRTIPWLILACVAGWAVLYLIGLPYMAAILNLHLKKGMDVATIFRVGMLIYLPGDALKVAATVILSKALLPVVDREFRK